MKATKILTLSFLAAVACYAAAERSMTSPTSHKYASNISEAEIDAITNDGYRMHDIEVTSTSPLRFAGSFVKNSGMYATGWWWTANKTEADLTAFYQQRSARILDLEVTIKDGQRRFAATFVENRGRDAKEWSWFDNATFDQMNAHAANTNQRIVDVDVYLVGSQRRFAGVMIKNTGLDHRNQWVFSNITKQQVSELVSKKNGRLTDLERISDNRFAGIVEESQGQMWWWQTDRSWEQLQFAVAQFGARVADIERYTKGSKSYFNYVLINNSNEVESRIGNLMRTNSDGARGFFLKRVGGPVLAGILEDYRIYPASTIKAIEHFYWINQIDNGLSTQTSVPQYSDHTSDTHPINGSTIQSNTTLIAAMNNMMVNSNNQDANGLQDFAGNGNGATGRTTINNFAKNTLGLSDDLKLNHKFAAQGANSQIPNVATMRQLGRLFEKAFDGSVLSANGQAMFRLQMRNDTLNFDFRNAVRTVISTEGALLGMDAADINNFTNQMQLCWKPGNWPSNSRYVSSSGWVSLPINNGLNAREFVLGGFVDNFTFNSLSMSGTVMPELLREEIRSALQTWQ